MRERASEKIHMDVRHIYHSCLALLTVERKQFQTFLQFCFQGIVLLLQFLFLLRGGKRPRYYRGYLVRELAEDKIHTEPKDSKRSTKLGEITL
jgi:hypothetical protein